MYRVDRYWVNGKPIARPESEIHEHVVLDPPLVSPADWGRAQDILATLSAKRPPRRDLGLVLTYYQFADYGVCGAEMWAQPPNGRGGYHAYRCGNRKGGKCSVGQVSGRLADPVIDRALEERLGDRDTLRRLIETAQEERESRRVTDH